jgi:hypothetical protein
MHVVNVGKKEKRNKKTQVHQEHEEEQVLSCLSLPLSFTLSFFLCLAATTPVCYTFLK